AAGGLRPPVTARVGGAVAERRAASLSACGRGGRTRGGDRLPRRVGPAYRRSRRPGRRAAHVPVDGRWLRLEDGGGAGEVPEAPRGRPGERNLPRAVDRPAWNGGRHDGRIARGPDSGLVPAHGRRDRRPPAGRGGRGAPPAPPHREGARNGGVPRRAS